MKKNDIAYRENLAARLRNQSAPTDERTAAVNEKGLAAAGAIAILYVVARLIWCGFHGELAVPELVLLFVMVLVMSAVKKQNGVYDMPRMFGVELDPAHVSLKKRMLYYAAESVIYAGSYTLVDFLLGITSWNRSIGGVIADFAIGFAVWMLITALLNEHAIKKCAAANAALDAEELDAED